MRRIRSSKIEGIANDRKFCPIVQGKFSFERQRTSGGAIALPQREHRIILENRKVEAVANPL